MRSILLIGVLLLACQGCASLIAEAVSAPIKIVGAVTKETIKVVKGATEVITSSDSEDSDDEADKDEDKKSDK